jgi:tRNA A37 threonylcarbamoyladenosine modification protein TsaB
VIGVSVAEAMQAALPNLGGRELWVAIDNRRGRIFLHRASRQGMAAPEPTALDALPPPEHRIAVAGDAAPEVASRLAAHDRDVMLTDLRLPPIRQVALVAAQRLRGERPPLPAQPLYVDPPEAKLPQGGLRPPPV